MRERLLVSGPNTGGKTVLLKAMGLCALMNQSGFFIPASKVLFQNVPEITFIGDDQNIKKGFQVFLLKFPI